MKKSDRRDIAAIIHKIADEHTDDLVERVKDKVTGAAAEDLVLTIYAASLVAAISKTQKISLTRFVNDIERMAKELHGQTARS